MEKHSLVNTESLTPSYTNGEGKSVQQVDSYTSALEKCDIGRYNLINLIFCGLAYLGAMSTILCVQYVLPGVQCHFGVTSDNRIPSVALSYAGVGIGAVVFGLCGDVIGRRPIIMFSLCSCAFLGLLSCASRSFSGFLFHSVLGCVCAGGTLPVLWSYFTEFQMPFIRGKAFCLLSLFWALSYIVPAGLPKLLTDTSYEKLPEYYGFAIWRLRLLINSILAIISAILFKFADESPEFILASGDATTSLSILNFIHTKNNSQEKMGSVLVADTQSNNINLWMNQDFSIRKAFSCFRNHLTEIPSKLTMSGVSLILITGFGFYSSCYSSLIVSPELFREIRSNNGLQFMTQTETFHMNSTFHEICQKAYDGQLYTGGFLVQVAIIAGSICGAVLWPPKSKGKIVIYGCLVSIFLSVFFRFAVTLKPFIYMFAATSIPTVAGTVAYWCLCLSATPTAYRSTVAGMALSVCSFGTILGYIIYYYLLFMGSKTLSIPTLAFCVMTVISTRLIQDGDYSPSK